MARAPYRTQSDTLKLQRLIEVLKERGSDLAGSLENKAKDFLNDVKPKVKPPLIPHYESDQDDGSSFGKVGKFIIILQQKFGTVSSSTLKLL